MMLQPAHLSDHSNPLNEGHFEMGIIVCPLVFQNHAMNPIESLPLKRRLSLRSAAFNRPNTFKNK